MGFDIEQQQTLITKDIKLDLPVRRGGQSSRLLLIPPRLTLKDRLFDVSVADQPTIVGLPVAETREQDVQTDIIHIYSIWDDIIKLAKGEYKPHPLPQSSNPAGNTSVGSPSEEKDPLDQEIDDALDLRILQKAIRRYLAKQSTMPMAAVELQKRVTHEQTPTETEIPVIIPAQQTENNHNQPDVTQYRSEYTFAQDADIAAVRMNIRQINEFDPVRYQKDVKSREPVYEEKEITIHDTGRPEFEDLYGKVLNFMHAHGIDPIDTATREPLQTPEVAFWVMRYFTDELLTNKNIERYMQNPGFRTFLMYHILHTNFRFTDLQLNIGDITVPFYDSERHPHNSGPSLWMTWNTRDRKTGKVILDPNNGPGIAVLRQYPSYDEYVKSIYGGFQKVT